MKSYNDQDSNIFEVVDILKDEKDFQELLDSTFEDFSVDEDYVNRIKKKTLDLYNKNQIKKRKISNLKRIIAIAACIILPLVFSYNLFFNKDIHSIERKDNSVSNQSSKNKTTDKSGNIIKTSVSPKNTTTSTIPAVNPSVTTNTNYSNTTINGVFVGNEPKDILNYEKWLGKKTEGVLAYIGDTSWEDFNVGWACDLWKNTNSTIIWSLPLIPKGANLTDSAKGNYNEHYKKVAKDLASFRSNESVIYIRTGWGFNGERFTWKAAGQTENYINTWKQFVNSFRSVSPKFKFEWCPHMGDLSMPAEKCYPGDSYVDSIGMEVFDESDSSKITNPVERWNFYLTRSHGLNWIESFANEHKKRVTIPVWGVGDKQSGDNEYLIEQLSNWMNKNNVLYENYWDSNADYKGMLRQNQYPKAAIKYKEYFGK